MNEILDNIGSLEDKRKLGLAIIIVVLIALNPLIVVMGIILTFLYIEAKRSIINKYEKVKKLVLDGSSFKKPIEELTPRREPIPEKIKMYIWKRDDGRCVYCKSNEKLEYDHIIPVSKGGSNTIRNIQLLCESCNRSKGTRIGLEEYF